MTDRPSHLAPRIDRVLTHIHTHLDGDLSLDALAEVAALSRFHFSRTFRDATGEGATEVVRRIRLNRAANLLAVTTLPLGRIARSCGYGHTDSFGRAFHRAFGQPPSAVRAASRMPLPIVPTKTGDWTMYPVEIRDETETTVAALFHQGPYLEIGPTFDRMDAMLREREVPTGPSIGIYYDNPQETPLDQLRAHAGRTIVDSDVPEEMDRVVIPAGRHAILTHVGPFDGLPAAWHYMFEVALPERGLRMREGLTFERYLNNVADTPIEKVVTEVCVPVADA
ncbi:MAG: AraC family transcriptional regulator [Pseudomonadota bacterium]